MTVKIESGDSLISFDDDTYLDKVATGIIQIGTQNAADVRIGGGYIDLYEITAPANPAADAGRLYVADDGGTTKLYFKDSAGTVTSLLEGGGGASDKISEGDTSIEVIDTGTDGHAVVTIDNAEVWRFANNGTLYQNGRSSLTLNGTSGHTPSLMLSGDQSGTSRNGIGIESGGGAAAIYMNAAGTSLAAPDTAYTLMGIIAFQGITTTTGNGYCYGADIRVSAQGNASASAAPAKFEIWTQSGVPAHAPRYAIENDGTWISHRFFGSGSSPMETVRIKARPTNSAGYMVVGDARIEPGTEVGPAAGDIVLDCVDGYVASYGSGEYEGADLGFICCRSGGTDVTNPYYLGYRWSSTMFLGEFGFAGKYNSSGTWAYTDVQATMKANATQGWTTSARGCEISFWVTPNNTTTKQEVLTLNQDKIVDVPYAFRAGSIVAGNITETAGAPLHVVSNTSGTFNKGAIIENEVSGNTPAQLVLHTNRGGGNNVDGDTVGTMDFTFQQSTIVTGAQIYAVVDDVTTATEDTHIGFKNYVNGTLYESLNLGGSALTLVAADGTAAAIQATCYDDGNSVGALINLKRSGGSSSSQSALGDDEVIGRLDFVGYDGSAWATTATVYAITEQAWSGSAQGTSIIFEVTATDTTSRSEAMRIVQNGRVGIGTADPIGDLDVRAADGNISSIYCISVSDTASHKAMLRLGHIREGATPTTLNNDHTGGIGFTGHTGSGYQDFWNIYSLCTSDMTPTNVRSNLYITARNDSSWTTCMQFRYDGQVRGNQMYSGYTIGGTNKDLYIDSTGLIGVLSSSERFKENIEDMPSTSWLHDLRPVTFNYKHDPEPLQYGLIAEEVALVNETLVTYDDNAQIDGVQYSRLIPALLKEVQELKKEIDILKQ